MTDRPDPADWIAKRRELLADATEGPWFQGREGRRYESDRDVYSEREPEHEGSHDIATYVWSAGDAALIADARTSLPRALDALEAVLAVHQGRPCYGEPGDDACPHDSEYEGDRHFESADGWILCEDTAGDDLHCSECTHADDDELTAWPCLTVDVAETALRGES